MGKAAKAGLPYAPVSASSPKDITFEKKGPEWYKSDEYLESLKTIDVTD